MNRDLLNNADLIERLKSEPGPFLPVCLCLDTSRSMRLPADGGLSRLEVLQNGIDQFYAIVSSDPLIRYTVNVAVVTFDSDAKVLRPFSLMESGKAPRLQLGAEETAMGPGLNKALDMIEDYCRLLKQYGADALTPWLILMSDGPGNKGLADFRRAKERIREMVEKNRLGLFPFAIGKGSHLKELNELSPEQLAFRLENFQMQKMFVWMYRQAKLVASSEDISAASKTKLGLEVYESWSAPLQRPAR